MSNDSITVITQYLQPGERLLWAGRPQQGLLLRGEDAFLIPFSLLWSLPTLSRVAAGAVSFNAFDVLFVVIGLYLLVGRFLVDAWLRSRTYYGVTDRQAIIVSLSVAAEMRSISLRTLSDVKLTVRRGGRGTIELGKPKRNSVFSPRVSRAMTVPGMNEYLPPAFEAILKAREVYDLIVLARQHALQNP